MKVLNLFKILLAFATAALIVGTGTVAGLFWHFSHGLPDHKQLADYQPAISSRLYAADGRLLAEYAREKRVFVPVAAMPKRVLEAFVAAEDQRFFSHPGVDFIGVMRAVIANVANPGKRPEGASGLTQQVAKNFLLSNQATLARKIREAILAFRIEETYSKERILELYLNEIYLGSGNYGVAQAAINYFDRSLNELTLSEIAYLAALPKAPNRYNLIRNEKEAYARRDYVLGRMLDDGYITAAEMQQAKAEKLQYRRRGNTEVVQADFFAEEVRRNLMAAYGEKGLYEGGLTVSTTLDPAIQAVADNALRDGLITYDRRHGWRGPYAKIPDMSVWEEEFARIVQRRPLGGPASWQLAVVSKIEPQAVQIIGLPSSDGGGGEGTVPFAEMTWAAPTLAEQRLGAPPRRPQDVVNVGDVIVVEKVEKPAGKDAKPYPPRTYALRQVPNVEGGVVVMDTQTGRVLAMSGGWSYGRSQFNRAVQAARQPGSAFKPFVYLAAMDSGFTPGSIVLDAPFSYDPGYGQPVWTPKNYGGDYPRADHGAARPRDVAQPHDRAHGPAGRHEEGGRGRQGIRRRRPDGRLPADGAGCRRDHLAAHDHGLRHAGQRRARDHAQRWSTACRTATAGPSTATSRAPAEAAASRPPRGKPVAPEIVDSRKPFHDPASVYQVVHMMLGVTTRGTARPPGGARPADRRQDRHDQRRARQLVPGLDARHHHRHLYRLRRAAHARPRQRRDRRRQCRADLRGHGQADLQGQGADAVPHPARPAHGQVLLRGRHDRRGLQARHRARLGGFQPDPA